MIAVNHTEGKSALEFGWDFIGNIEGIDAMMRVRKRLPRLRRVPAHPPRLRLLRRRRRIIPLLVIAEPELFALMPSMSVEFHTEGKVLDIVCVTYTDLIVASLTVSHGSSPRHLALLPRRRRLQLYLPSRRIMGNFPARQGESISYGHQGHGA